jgi:hypothetical protein
MVKTLEATILLYTYDISCFKPKRHLSQLRSDVLRHGATEKTPGLGDHPGGASGRRPFMSIINPDKKGIYVLLIYIYSILISYLVFCI